MCTCTLKPVSVKGLWGLTERAPSDQSGKYKWSNTYINEENRQIFLAEKFQMIYVGISLSGTFPNPQLWAALRDFCQRVPFGKRGQRGVGRHLKREQLYTWETW